MRPIEQFLFRQIKLRHLHLLVALADLQTVGKVAEMLHVTQPAISRMIADLERGVGIALFERNGRRIRPTPAGASLILHARDILARAQRAGDALEAIANGIGGRIEVGLLAVAAAALVPQATQLFKVQARTTTVALHEGTLDQLIPGLQAGHLDLIVGRLSKELMDDASLSFEPLFEDPPVIVVSSSHPLARKRSVKWRDLSGLPWILPPVAAPMHRRLLAVLADHGIEAPDDVIESNTNLGNVPLLRGSNRLCLEPRSQALELQDEGSAAIVPLPLGGVLGPVGAVLRKEVERTPMVALFLECLRESALAVRPKGSVPKSASVLRS
jgi:DNA-binding transcriptional LysR family regulator